MPSQGAKLLCSFAKLSVEEQHLLSVLLLRLVPQKVQVVNEKHH